MPGEYLWRRVIEVDENDTFLFPAIIFIPIVVATIALSGLAHLPTSLATLGLVSVGVLFTLSLSLCIYFLQRRLQRRADDYLGFFGERYVAEILEPLKATGWFIFHDIQCTGATGKFNLDHVAVGPGGVWVFETKTRRKGRANPGLKEWRVVFDGNQIMGPWGEDTRALKQIRNNVEWLSKWLTKMTGKDFPVHGVVTFPGYEVIEKKLADVRVVYTKGLRGVVISLGDEILDPKDIDLIRRQLEEKCRDIDF
jgi:hypothetical protein